MANATTYLKFANVQMAAEALLDQFAFKTQEGLASALKFGNNRSSKFTSTSATEFSKLWEVVEHESNTSTGFSGTLFRARADAPQELLSKYGVVAGELTLSFRSTEFADDAARDNQATNDLEIRSFGWAFGQISDMQKWVNSLRTRNEIKPQIPLSVTGYSLGGHLAAAFELLYPGTATSIYTFNGAGVGIITDSASLDLSRVISRFDQRRTTGSNADLFTNSQVRDLYDTYKGLVTYANGVITVDVINAAIDQATVLFNLFPTISKAFDEASLLLAALKRARTIAAEAVRVTGMVSGGGTGTNVVGVGLYNIEAIGLDYQLAVLKAGEKTASFGDTNALGKANGTIGRTTDNRANIFDLYGAQSAAGPGKYCLGSY